jgi:hypothetical protein
MWYPFLLVLLFLGRVFGQLRLPLRVMFFVWTTELGKILTLDSVKKRNITVMDCCCICKKIMEFTYQSVWWCLSYA